KPVLLVGAVALIASCLLIASATVYLQAAIGRMLGGFAGGCLATAAFAAGADISDSSARGRIMGWLVAGQSLSMVIGTPIVALIAAASSWRWGVASPGLVTIPALFLLLLLVPGGRPARVTQDTGSRLDRREMLSSGFLAAFAVTAIERFSYASAASFFATFLIAEYNLTLTLVAPAIGLVAAGNVIGSVIGGRVADRTRHKRVIVGLALGISSLLALPMLSSQLGPETSILFGTLFATVNAWGRPSILSILSDLSPEHRGSIMGLGISLGSLGWLSSSAIGSFLIELGGFGALALAVCVLGLIGAALAFVTRREAPAVVQAAAAR
ncbi:MAG: MFS transporter, partial [Chloroflexi bacterium]|nr:MFS transporter [Chloroflexota bacterium]